MESAVLRGGGGGRWRRMSHATGNKVKPSREGGGCRAAERRWTGRVCVWRCAALAASCAVPRVGTTLFFVFSRLHTNEDTRVDAAGLGGDIGMLRLRRDCVVRDTPFVVCVSRVPALVAGCRKWCSLFAGVREAATWKVRTHTNDKQMTLMGGVSCFGFAGGGGWGGGGRRISRWEDADRDISVITLRPRETRESVCARRV